MDNGVKIFIAFHKFYFCCSNDIFIPIQVGASLAKKRLDMLGDNTGENISDKNPYFCELTALYWILKNIKCDYIGICHYRRYFMFGEKWYIKVLYHALSSGITYPYFLRNKIIKMYSHCTKAVSNSKAFYDKTKINSISYIDSMIKKYDIILPHREYLGETVANNYCANHKKDDWETLILYLKNNFDIYSNYIDDVFYSRRSFYPYNMFVMRYDIFKDYCEWMFDVLFGIEKDIFISDNIYQQRVFGFLSERLLTLYIETIRDRYKIKEVATLFVK